MVNLLVTILLGGLWHGANFTFIIWGALHGAMLALERLVGEDRLSRISPMVRHAVTFVIVVFGWVIFRSDSMSQAGNIFSGMLGFNGFMTSFNPLLLQKHLPGCMLAALAILFIWKLEPLLINPSPIAKRAFSSRVQRGIFFTFLVAFLFSLSSSEIPFLYFQF